MESKIHRERLSAKRMKEEIKNNNGILDTTLTERDFNDTYILKNGKVIVSFGAHGFLYNSVEELKQWEKDLDKTFQGKTNASYFSGQIVVWKRFSWKDRLPN